MKPLNLQIVCNVFCNLILFITLNNLTQLILKKNSYCFLINIQFLYNFEADMIMFIGERNNKYQ